jgi:hypothetical protein
MLQTPTPTLPTLGSLRSPGGREQSPSPPAKRRVGRAAVGALPKEPK